MIPLHRPPFGIGTVLAAALSGSDRTSLSRLEETYAKAAGMPAIWLPSARAGIAWALRTASNAHHKILAPAFTCAAVHDALQVADGAVEFIDATNDDFLPSPESLAAQSTGNYSQVLCEVYGHTYDLAALSKTSAAQPQIRIVDMAMAVPHPDLFQRLEARDFAVISFGAGKSMYAGWGAIGFSRNQALIDEVRNSRDRVLVRESSGLTAHRALESFARVIGNYPSVHALARTLREKLKRRSGGESAVSQNAGLNVNPATASEWRLPSTRIDRSLALWNLDHAQTSHEARVKLAQQYHRNLAGANGIICPKPSRDALSHFTVLIGGGLRDSVKAKLYAASINTITLWAFSPRLNRNKFPGAARLSSEVLNLPLSPWMSAHQLDHVCEVLTRNVNASQQGLDKRR